MVIERKIVRCREKLVLRKSGGRRGTERRKKKKKYSVGVFLQMLFSRTI